MKNIAIYLAGSIQKSHEKGNELVWTEEHLQELRQSLPSFHLSFLNPAYRTDDLCDEKAVFGRDMLQVFSSDIVLVDARDRRGLGVGAEMMWAKMHAIPVITWSPQESHYRKRSIVMLGQEVIDFVHPFVESLSDILVEDMSEAAQAIQQVMEKEGFRPKDKETIMACIEHYKQTQLDRDVPMQQLMQQNEALKSRVQAISSHVGLLV